MQKFSTALILVLLTITTAVSARAQASELDGPYNSPLRVRCTEIAVSVAKRLGEIPRHQGGFFPLPLASNGGIMNERFYCATTCETYVSEMLSTGRAEAPQVKCGRRN